MATGHVVMRKYTILQIVIVILMAMTMVGFSGASASASASGWKYGSGDHGHSKKSGHGSTPSSGCGNNCPVPLPNPPVCSWNIDGGVGSGAIPSSGAPATVYVIQCSPACRQSGGKVGCKPPTSSPCTNGHEWETINNGFYDACPYTGGTTTSWSEQYGYSAHPGNVCVSKWLVTYVGQVYKTVPTGCSASLSMPANYFHQSCQGANTPTTATVQYWLQLPLISPPTSPPPGWAVAGWPPSTSTSGGGASYPDGSDALLGPYTQTVTVPPCPVYQGIKYGNYVLTQLNDGNGIAGGQPVVVGTNPYGGTAQHGLYVVDDGAVHHYVFGFKIQLPPSVSSVGVDPYLRWEGGTASVANISQYGHLHDMFGNLLPAWNLHFSSFSAGETSCPSGRRGYCNTPSSTSSNYGWSGWYLASEWASGANPPINWAHPVVPAKEIVDFEIHEPTVAGAPLQLQLNGKMQAGWFYNYFSINASVSGTQRTTTFTGTQPQTETIEKTAPSKSKSACAENHATMRNGWCTITTTSTQINTISQIFDFVYPATVSATVSTTQLTPTNEVLSKPFPVRVTADIQAKGAFLVGSS